MKKWKKVIVSLFTIGVLSGSFVVSAFAEEDPYNMPAYTYKITLSAGNQGSIDGQDKIEWDKPASSIENLSDYLDSVTLTDEKYYVKGVRRCGRDNEEGVDPPAFTVSEDADYVIAYGIKGDQVAYTVNYLDASGNELLPSATLYGNVGDKPVVAYRYVDGYVPQALALTKTLSSNAAENIFNFEYKQGDSRTLITTTTETVVVTQNVPAGTTGTTGTAGTTGTTAQGTTTQGTTTAGTAQGTETAATDTESAGGQAAGEQVNVPDDTTPQSVLNLDNEEVPKANEQISNDPAKKGLPLAAGLTLIAVSIAAFAMLVIVLLRKRSE